jgi:hypothetical protein
MDVKSIDNNFASIKLKRGIMNNILLVFVALIVFVGFGTASAQSSNSNLPVKSFISQPLNAGKSFSKPRTIKMFRRIKRQMSMKQIIRLCGEPDKDIGSGIHIYVYKLADGSVVQVGTPDDKKILYVVQGTANGKDRYLLRNK